MIKTIILPVTFLCAMIFGATTGYASSADVVVITAGQTQTVDAFSNCRRVTNPTGGAIAVFKNTVDEWNSLIASPGALTLAACGEPCTYGAVGSVCGDGAIYAGSHAGKRIYIANNDETGTYKWKTTNTSTSGADDDDDGFANTNVMISAGAADHPAAQRCRNRGADWYVPSENEIDVLDNYLVAGEDYWTSTQTTTAENALEYRDGVHASALKGSNNLVWCVRQ